MRCFSQCNKQQRNKRHTYQKIRNKNCPYLQMVYRENSKESIKKKKKKPLRTSKWVKQGGRCKINVKNQLYFCIIAIEASHMAQDKESICNAGHTGDVGLIPGSGRYSGGGHSKPIQYSCLENPMGKRPWWATVHRITKSWTWLKQLKHASRNNSKDISLLCLSQKLQWLELL